MGLDENLTVVVTGAAAGIGQTTQQMMDQPHPVGRIGTSQEMGEIIVWLKSPRAFFMTGAVIPVDGGYVTR